MSLKTNPMIGRVLIYSRGGRDRNPLMLLRLALSVMGAIGVFIGRLGECLCQSRRWGALRL